MATDPPRRPRFTDSQAFKVVPILLSLVALIVSVGSLYWKDLSERPHLVATVADLTLPATEDPASDPPGQTRGTLRARLILSNPGNRPASLTRVEVELLSRPLGTALPLAKACDRPAAPETLRFALASPALPAIVAPGALVAAPATADILFDWARLHGSRHIESCIVFTTLDNQGVTRTRRAPLATWIVEPENRRDALPAPEKPKAPYVLL